MALPGNVPIIRNVDLIDFDLVDLQIIARPLSASLQAWAAAEEAERRFMMFDMLGTYIPEPRNWRMFSEFAGGFLLTFEVAIQHFLKDFEQRSLGSPSDFYSWLAKHSDPDRHGDPELYNIEVRGLRLMRHIVAHHEPLTLVHSQGEEDTQFRNTSWGKTVRRHFPAVSKAQFDAVAAHNKRLILEADLPEWNQRTETMTARRLMHEGLRRLKHLLSEAENDWR